MRYPVCPAVWIGGTAAQCVTVSQSETLFPDDWGSDGSSADVLDDALELSVEAELSKHLFLECWL